MNNLYKVDRGLWVLTGVTSFPFVILALLEYDKLIVPEIYFLMALAGLFNGLIVPFFLMKGAANPLKKTLAIGANLLISYAWIKYTGGLDSIFYPTFYLLPVMAAAMYGGAVDSFLAACFSGILTLQLKGSVAGYSLASMVTPTVLVYLILFFLVSLSLGYLLKMYREQASRSYKMTEELEIAYNQLTANHDQLQSYTGIIEKMNREMEQLAITDELTGLYNYRYFQISLDKELKRNRYSYLTLIMFDIDKFKEFNERFGHPAGDRMLVEMGRIMRQEVREVDAVFRYGGGEFAVVMPSTELEEAYQGAERIRKLIADFVMMIPDGRGGKTNRTGSVTVCGGIACFPSDSKSKTELISHADLALYRAKENGGNCTIAYSLMDADPAPAPAKDSDLRSPRTLKTK